jgi:2-dehydro-3-deoxyphosphooctonate aldolase (KDO 8-P synthase)
MTQATQRDVPVRDLVISNDRPLAVIAGPCQIEGRDHALRIAETMARVCAAQGACASSRMCATRSAARP